MGNWRTVNMRGSLAADEVAAARKWATPKDDWSNFGPLSMTEGLCGLGDWPRQTIEVDGNLAERDFSVEDVADSLRDLVKIAPSLKLKVHCGADWESEDCIATVTVADGEVSVGEPEMARIRGVSETVMLGRLTQAMWGQGSR